MRASIVATGMFILALFTLSGCSSKNDKMIEDAAINFNQTVSNNKEDQTYHTELSHFGIKLKGGDKLEWTANPSASEADFSITINAKELMDAGLDVTKLDSQYLSVQKDSETNSDLLIYKYDVSQEQTSQSSSEEAFKALISVIPEQLSAIQNDGYILSFDEGFQLHWNSTDRANKDLAFIIASEDLVKAGLNVDRLVTWKVMKNKDPKDTQVKLFKVYYLK